MQRMGLTQRWQRCGFAKTLWLVEPTPPSTTIPNLVSENTYSRQLGEEERSNPSALGQRRGAWHSGTSQRSRRPTHLYLDSRADVGEVTRKSKRGHLRTDDRCCAPGRHARRVGARRLRAQASAYCDRLWASHRLAHVGVYPSTSRYGRSQGTLNFREAIVSTH